MSDCRKDITDTNVEQDQRMTDFKETVLDEPPREWFRSGFETTEPSENATAPTLDRREDISSLISSHGNTHGNSVAWNLVEDSQREKEPWLSLPKVLSSFSPEVNQLASNVHATQMSDQSWQMKNGIDNKTSQHSFSTSANTVSSGGWTSTESFAQVRAQRAVQELNPHIRSLETGSWGWNVKV